MTWKGVYIEQIANLTKDCVKMTSFEKRLTHLGWFSTATSSLAPSQASLAPRHLGALELAQHHLKPTKE